MSFATSLAKDGIASVWLLDVSFDNFVTVAYRWSTVSATIGGNLYEGRFTAQGRLDRGFGLDGLQQAGQLALRLDNTDFAVDFLVDSAQSLIAARFKLQLALYDPADNPTTRAYDLKQFGTFSVLDFPSRDAQSVSLVLADDSMGIFNNLVTTPSIREWLAASAGSTTNPLVDPDRVVTPVADWDAPIQLAWGPSADAQLAAVYEPLQRDDWNSPSACRHVFVICATNGNSALTTAAPRLFVTYFDDARVAPSAAGDTPPEVGGLRGELPQKVTLSHAWGFPPLSAGAELVLWTTHESVVRKNGVDWVVLWVELNTIAYAQWFVHTFNTPYIASDPTTVQVSSVDKGYLPQRPLDADNSLSGIATGPFEQAIRALKMVTLLGGPFSAHHGTADPQLGLDALKDLVEFYSQAGPALGVPYDTARFAVAAQSVNVPVARMLSPARPVGAVFKPTTNSLLGDAMKMGDMRQAISDLAATIGVDVFMTTDGLLGVSAGWMDITTLSATLPVIDETRSSNFIDKVPSSGERWTPFNRVFVTVANGDTLGPWDNAAAIAQWGRVISKTITARWAVPYDNASPEAEAAAWQLQRRMESVVRPIIRFTHDREALVYELGDVVSLSWTRGNTGFPYNAVPFRLEAMSIDMQTLEVELTAVNASEMLTSSPFLLDDENFVFFNDSGGAGFGVTVVDGSHFATFDVHDPPPGTAVGDILCILRNATGRMNSMHRITQVRAHDLILADDDLDFGAPAGGPFIFDWRLFHGVTTYPTAVSDPVNYPAGSAFYGKATATDGTFSNTNNGNKLL